MFVGREFELDALNRMYREDRFHFIPITGRRRVGKTRLIEEFIKDKPAVMFRAVPGNENINLSMFNELVSGDSEHPHPFLILTDHCWIQTREIIHGYDLCAM